LFSNQKANIKKRKMRKWKFLILQQPEKPDAQTCKGYILNCPIIDCCRRPAVGVTVNSVTIVPTVCLETNKWGMGVCLGVGVGVGVGVVGELELVTRLVLFQTENGQKLIVNGS
jgi:hypothetical protein